MDHRGGKYECYISKFQINNPHHSFTSVYSYYDLDEESAREDMLRLYERCHKDLEDQIYSRLDDSDYFKNMLDKSDEFKELPQEKKRSLNWFFNEMIKDKLDEQTRKLMKVLALSDYYGSRWK